MNISSLEPVFYPISVSDESDSHVYSCSISDRVTKIYSECDERCLESYARLQNELAEDDMEIDLEEEHIYNGEIFTHVHISILKLPEVSYPASLIKEQKPVWITSPKYVRWKNLHEIKYLENNGLCTRDILQLIEEIVDKFISHRSAKQSMEWAQWIPGNASICWIKDKSLQIVITDVAPNIRRFVNLNVVFGC